MPNDSERKTKQTLEVTDSREIADGIFSLTLQYPAGMEPAAVKPGQFVGLYPSDSALLLPRPISICEWDKGTGRLRLVYRVVGNGTGEFSGLRPGDAVDVLGILGNGYDLSLLEGRRVLLLGGGIGAPPMLGLAERIAGINREADGSSSGCVTAVMGYRTNDLFLTDEFRKVSRLVIATDDGSAGIHGNVLDAVHEIQKEQDAGFDVICACGPLPMLRGVKRLSEELGIPAFLSLEERMACGVGACLGCVVKTAEVDGHSHVRNARVCTEGPVFPAEEVEI